MLDIHEAIRALRFAPNTLLILDSNRQVRIASRQADELFGDGAGEVVGKCVEHLWAPEGGSRQELSLALNEASQRPGDVVVRRLKAEKSWVAMSVVAWHPTDNPMSASVQLPASAISTPQNVLAHGCFYTVSLRDDRQEPGDGEGTARQMDLHPTVEPLAGEDRAGTSSVQPSNMATPLVPEVAVAALISTPPPFFPPPLSPSHPVMDTLPHGTAAETDALVFSPVLVLSADGSVSVRNQVCAKKMDSPDTETSVALPSKNHHKKAPVDSIPEGTNRRLAKGKGVAAGERNAGSSHLTRGRKKQNLKYEVGSVVLGKVKGFPPTPGEILDLKWAPREVMAERPDPKKQMFYCVRFFPIGDHAWLLPKDVSRLQAHEISAFLQKPRKKGDLLEAYKIAKDPIEWWVEKNALAARERETEDEHEAKRKRNSGRLTKWGTNEGQESVDYMKSEDQELEDFEDEISLVDEERPPKRAKKQLMALQITATDVKENMNDGSAATFSDPEAAKVLEWRNRLHRAFLATAPPVPDKDMAEINVIFTAIEQYDKMTVEYLAYSKIGDNMREIFRFPDIPSDGRYHFRQRAQALVTKWHQLTMAAGDHR